MESIRSYIPQIIVLDNPLEMWLRFVAITILLSIVIIALRRFLVCRFKKLATRTQTIVDDVFISFLEHLKRWAVVYISLYVASRSLTISSRIDKSLYGILVVVITLQLATWGRLGIKFILERVIRRREKENHGTDAVLRTTMPTFEFVLSILLWGVLIVLAVDNLGFDVTALLTGLGVGGIAIALAVQNILGDLFASLSIIMDRPFVVGDSIAVGNDSGTVEKIGLKTTRVRSTSGEQLIFANSDLLSARVRNYKRMDERRVILQLPVVLRGNIGRLANLPEMIKQIVEKEAKVRFDRAHITDAKGGAATLEVVYFYLGADFNGHMDIQQRILLAALEKFEAEKIEVSVPTQSFILKDPNAIKAA